MPPRPLRYMDAISNGLDSATTYDIVQAVKLITKTVGLTTVVSLLQVCSMWPCLFLCFDYFFIVDCHSVGKLFTEQVIDDTTILPLTLVHFYFFS